MIDLSPDASEFVTEWIFSVFAADVDDDVRMTSVALEGAQDVSGVALVDDDV